MTISMRRMLLTAGGAVLLGLAAIGLVQAAASTGPAPAVPLAAVPAAETSTTAGASDEALATEFDAILAADQTTAAQPGLGALRRLRAGRLLVHATVVVDLPKKGLTTVQLDHGKVAAVGATSLTVAEADGSSATVTLGADTRVRKNAARAAVSDLRTGDEVFVMSKVEAGGTVAYLVVVPKA